MARWGDMIDMTKRETCPHRHARSLREPSRLGDQRGMETMTARLVLRGETWTIEIKGKTVQIRDINVSVVRVGNWAK